MYDFDDRMESNRRYALYESGRASAALLSGALLLNMVAEVTLRKLTPPGQVSWLMAGIGLGIGLTLVFFLANGSQIARWMVIVCGGLVGIGSTLGALTMLNNIEAMTAQMPERLAHLTIAMMGGQGLLFLLVVGTLLFSSSVRVFYSGKV